MSARERLGLDVALFALIIVCANPAWTGIAPHEWIGIALVVPALVHLIFNWEWVERTMARLFEKIRAASAVNLVVDSALFVATVTVTLSGVMVMPELVTASDGMVSRTWLALHTVSSDVTVIALLVHLALHARWIAGVACRMRAPRASVRPARQRTLEPARVRGSVERRSRYAEEGSR